MECRFGELAVVATGPHEFEIVHLKGDGSGAAVARFSVDEADLPRLRIDPLEPERRNLGSIAEAVDPVVLDSRRGDYETCFELSVKRMDNGIEINLSGDHRLTTGARHFKVFLWRAACKIVDGNPALHGPYLLRDLDS